MIYIGIDPGINGALAALGKDWQRANVMPIVAGIAGGTKSTLDIGAIVHWLKTAIHNDLLNVNEEVLVGLEKVSAMPKQGITSAFNFGQTYGILKGIVVTLGYPLELVRPQAWKKIILEGTLKDKSAAIQYIKQRYPDLNLKATERCRVDHDGMADAICIAAYLERTHHQ